MKKQLIVFIVEDNPTEGMIIQMALNGQENMKLRYFKSGTEMLFTLDNEMPDILI